MFHHIVFRQGGNQDIFDVVYLMQSYMNTKINNHSKTHKYIYNLWNFYTYIHTYISEWTINSLLSSVTTITKNDRGGTVRFSFFFLPARVVMRVKGIRVFGWLVWRVFNGRHSEVLKWQLVEIMLLCLTHLQPKSQHVLQCRPVIRINVSGFSFFLSFSSFFFKSGSEYTHTHACKYIYLIITSETPKF